MKNNNLKEERSRLDKSSVRTKGAFSIYNPGSAENRRQVEAFYALTYRFNQDRFNQVIDSPSNTCSTSSTGAQSNNTSAESSPETKPYKAAVSTDKIVGVWLNGLKDLKL